MSSDENYLAKLIKELNINENPIFNIGKEVEKIEVSKANLDENDGFIEVRDNQIFIINPSKKGKQPILVPNPEVRVLVNSSLLTKERVVFEEDEIIWEVPNKAEYKISTSKDNLCVYLHLSPELFTMFRLKNKKRSNQFIIETELVKKTLNTEDVVSQISEAVFKRGVRVEINTTAIIEELINPTFKAVIIAEGLPVIPARDGFIKQYFSSTISEVLEEIQGVVDFKNRIKIPVVEAGEVIAEIIFPKDGMPGYDVFGQSLDPKSPKKIVVRTKPRVKITADGQVIALLSGRPTVTGNSIKQFDVLEAYEVSGDLDISTGNILFNGDVIIRGDVKDNMTVECSGSIFVFGNVYHSVLTASQNISIYGNIINSRLNGGQFGLYYSEAYKVAQHLSSALKHLLSALNQLKNAMDIKEFESGIGFITATLVEKKFNSITENVKEYSRIINDLKKHKFKLPLHFKLVMNTLVKFKNYQSIQLIDSVGFIQSVQFALNDLIQKMENEIMEESDIVFYSANVSQIKTNGKIIIKKEGIVNTTLFSGTEIIFKDKQSVIRGGKVEAVQKITAGIVGTPRGEIPTLYAGKEIIVNELNYADITLQNQKLVIDEIVANLVLKYNEEKDEVESNIALKSYW